MESIEKIDAFPTPNFLSLGEGTGMNIDVSSIVPVIFAIAFFLWLVYTLIAAYHWLRYGHRSFLTIPMLALHVVVSGMLMLLATVGLK